LRHIGEVKMRTDMPQELRGATGTPAPDGGIDTAIDVQVPVFVDHDEIGCNRFRKNGILSLEAQLADAIGMVDVQRFVPQVLNLDEH
jgi:hypothetical protein